MEENALSCDPRFNIEGIEEIMTSIKDGMGENENGEKTDRIVKHVRL